MSDQKFAQVVDIGDRVRILRIGQIVSIDQVSPNWQIQLTVGDAFKIDEDEAKKLFKKLGLGKRKKLGAI